MKEHEYTTVPRKARLGVDLRRFQVLLAEAGLVLSLATMIILVRMPLNLEQDFVVPEYQPITVEMEDVEQSEHLKKPPPPPRPPVPIEVPNDEILEDEALDIDAEIDFDEPAELPPPPALQEEEEPDVFIVVEKMPEMVGGIASLYSVLEYPELARRAGIEGLVVVQFVIEKDGSPTNLEVLKSANQILDAEALRAVALLRFIPGMQRGKAVRVRFAVPVRFTLKQAAPPVG
jgi:protein TonB